MSEVGRGPQPLPHWPQEFSSHLRSNITTGRPSLSSFDEAEEPPSPTGGLERSDVPESNVANGGAWSVPSKMVSVLDMLSGPPSSSWEAQSDAGSETELSVSSRREKKRPKPLNLFTLSPSATSIAPVPSHLVLAKSTSNRRLSTDSVHVDQGKDEFLASTFHPLIGRSASSPTLLTYTCTDIDSPATPPIVEGTTSSLGGSLLTRSRTQSGGSSRSIAANGAEGSKEKEGEKEKKGFGALKSFFKGRR